MSAHYGMLSVQINHDYYVILHRQTKSEVPITILKEIASFTYYACKNTKMHVQARLLRSLAYIDISDLFVLSVIGTLIWLLCSCNIINLYGNTPLPPFPKGSHVTSRGGGGWSRIVIIEGAQIMCTWCTSRARSFLRRGSCRGRKRALEAVGFLMLSHAIREPHLKHSDTKPD